MIGFEEISWATDMGAQFASAAKRRNNPDTTTLQLLISCLREVYCGLPIVCPRFVSQAAQAQKQPDKQERPQKPAEQPPRFVPAASVFRIHDTPFQKEEQTLQPTSLHTNFQQSSLKQRQQPQSPGLRQMIIVPIQALPIQFHPP